MKYKIFSAHKPEGFNKPIWNPVGHMNSFKTGNAGFRVTLYIFPNSDIIALPAQGRPGEYNLLCPPPGEKKERTRLLELGKMWARTKGVGFNIRLNINPACSYMAFEEQDERQPSAAPAEETPPEASDDEYDDIPF